MHDNETDSKVGINPESTDFSPTDNTVFSTQSVKLKPDKPSPWVWIGLGSLSIVALFVIFVLPSIVSEYELPLERRVELVDLQTTQPGLETAAAISPFEEAQRGIQRKDAQDVLAELLEIQSELGELEVMEWGQVAYETALEQASIGDDYYRGQDFGLAKDSYALSRDGLSELIESVPAVLSQTLIDAQKALENANSTLAADKYSLALLFDANNETAQIGLERARSLDDVGELLAIAAEQLNDGDLESARASYQQIVGLDKYNQLAIAKIAEVSALILENEFASIMSAGYVLLENAQPEQAISTFQQASALGINLDQALAAITQTENEIANVEIGRLRELISLAEADEQWQAAVDEYDQVIAIDQNLIFAINGRDYASKRAQLDQLLVSAIENPERFAEDSVFEQTRDVYFTGRAIEDPGSRLDGQLNELQTLLENSQVPIDIQLSSDNLTDVTLLRIGNLGNFEKTSLSLKPGRYVAVGKRVGFREVREEFVIGFGQTPDIVIVRCDEPVVASNRR